MNDFITIHNPTLEEIIDFGDMGYMFLISALTARPYDAAVQLYDAGINYKQVGEFEFFIKNMRGASPTDTRILFGDLDFSVFQVGENSQNGELIFYSPETEEHPAITIDRVLYSEIVDVIRSMHYISAEVEYDMADGEVNMRFFIERMRRKLKKQQRVSLQDPYFDLISLLVNAEGSKYDYETVFTMHISQFYNAFYRLHKIQEFRQVMAGVYAGTVDGSKLNFKDLNWAGAINISPSRADAEKEKQLTLEK